MPVLMNALGRAVPCLLLLASAAPAHAKDEPSTPPSTPAPLPAPTDATLSLLEPAAAESCEWSWFDPLSSTRRVLARLAVGCQGGATALSQDGHHGAARFWRGGVSAPVVGRPSFPEPYPSPAFRDRLFLVDLTTGSAEELPLPTGAGELIEFGFDAQGRLLGLTLQRPTAEQEQAGEVQVGGKTLRLDPVDGQEHPVLTQGFVWREGAWTRLEVQVTTEQRGTGALALRKQLGPRSNRALDPRFKPEELSNDAVLEQLYAFTPEQPDGEWVGLKRGGFSLALWGTPFGEEMLATGLVRRVDRGKVVALPSLGLRANDLISLQARGPFLLVSLADSGGHPRLYRGRKLVWSSEDARAVTLWPK